MLSPLHHIEDKQQSMVCVAIYNLWKKVFRELLDYLLIGLKENLVFFHIVTGFNFYSYWYLWVVVLQLPSMAVIEQPSNN